MIREIHIKGAREHNLKNIDVTLPRDRLIVLTGVSGSGKSSLAFDTIYAEGQRRYIESLSAYTRQFLEQMGKPDLDSIEGLSPAICIRQKTTSHNPRSTVGTITELYDYFRLLFARVGRPFCYQCGKPIAAQTISQMVDALMAIPEGETLHILSPVIRGRKGEFKKEIDLIRQKGFTRLRIDGKMIDLTQETAQIRGKTQKHTLEVVVDRLILKAGLERRLAESLEMATQMSEGLAIVLRDQQEMLFSEHQACIGCGVSYPTIEPRLFSFNSPYGACPTCSGIGMAMIPNPHKIVPNDRLSIHRGAIRPWIWNLAYTENPVLRAVIARFHMDIDLPFGDLPQEHRHILFYGSDSEKIVLTLEGKRVLFEGIVPNLQRLYREASSGSIREEIEVYMTPHPCEVCQGTRLKPESLAIRVGGQSIAEVTHMSIGEALQWITQLQLTGKEEQIAQRLLKEIRERLTFLNNVGTDYLALDRSASTLAGGESQRIRLATQIGSSLMGVLYILDEPSIGLHQRDNARLLDTLKHLRDLGNTVLVVEHDQETIESADWVVDMGPGAGIYGGQVVAAGTPQEIAASGSLTGDYLSGNKVVSLPPRHRIARGYLKIQGACENNLKHIDVEIPVGLLSCVTGVSGSGKSTLILNVLLEGLMQQRLGHPQSSTKYQAIIGVEHFDKIIHIDQSPIGRTPRSNPATYTGVFTLIRDFYANLPLSRMRGYQAGRYSFNVKGGRCETCRGDGLLKIEMHFLPDVYVPCEACHGKRYNRETLDVRYREASIAGVLDMTVDTALDFFKSVPPIHEMLTTLQEVGLGYLKLGQSATTLSGGEAQRIKLSREIVRRATGRTLYILDEPTTGLHFADVQKLLDILNRFVGSGNTVIVIEHNLDVIRNADWIIDLGPEGGDRGGEVIACGTPEIVAATPRSHTGQFLKQGFADNTLRKAE